MMSLPASSYTFLHAEPCTVLYTFFITDQAYDKSLQACSVLYTTWRSHSISPQGPTFSDVAPHFTSLT